jgi:hypothetical protein
MTPTITPADCARIRTKCAADRYTSGRFKTTIKFAIIGILFTAAMWIATAGISSAWRAEKANAEQDVRIQNMEKMLDRIDKKLDFMIDEKYR